MVRSLDGTNHALLDSGSGLTSCPLSCAEALSSLPRPDKLPTLSNATVRMRGKYRIATSSLSSGERRTLGSDLACVNKRGELDRVSTESVIAANIEVRVETCRRSLIMNRTDTRTSVVLYKFARDLVLPPSGCKRLEQGTRR